MRALGIASLIFCCGITTGCVLSKLTMHDDAGVGGNDSQGGSTSSSIDTGGIQVTVGGTSSQGEGGGSVGTGGASANSTGLGGTEPSGGGESNAGNTGSGGAIAGGTVASGGAAQGGAGTGGAVGTTLTGGVGTTGGTMASVGGATMMGGSGATGGLAAIGGIASTGGTTNAVNAGGAATGGAPSTGVALAYCTIESVRYSSGDYNLDNHCLICQPSETTTEWVIASEGANCDPGKLCHNRTCQAGCIIGGTYYADGTKNSKDSCQSCQSATLTTDWTALPNIEGTSCGTGQVCHSGSCQAGCFIGGTHYADGTKNSKDACQSCQSTTLTTDWTPLPNIEGTACGTGQVCHAGACAAGCWIGSVYYASGASNGPCQSCQPTALTTDWTPDGASCGCTGSLETVQRSTGLCVAKMAEITGVASDAGNTDYSIDVTEVTKGQYDQWLGTKPALPASTDANCSYVTSYAEQGTGTGDAHHPVVYVDWCDACAYCKGVGKRLCGAIGGGSNAFASYADATLSQWYRACSSGGANRYPYGSTYQATYCDGADYSSGTDKTVTVGLLTSCVTSATGFASVYDLSGNVWEWEDSCDKTGQSAICRVRGGAFDSYYIVYKLYISSSTLECGYSSSRTRNAASNDVGFRCCSP